MKTMFEEPTMQVIIFGSNDIFITESNSRSLQIQSYDLGDDEAAGGFFESTISLPSDE